MLDVLHDKNLKCDRFILNEKWFMWWKCKNRSFILQQVIYECFEINVIKSFANNALKGVNINKLEMHKSKCVKITPQIGL